MARAKRIVSSVLLAAGIVLVFAGLTAALGLSIPSLIVSVAAVATLLYAGAVWFGPVPPALAPAGAEIVIVFDRSLHIAAGARPGTPLLTQFPAPVRDTVEAHCRAALAGEHSHFRCEIGGRLVSFDVAPIQTLAGVVFYGVLVAGAGLPVPAGTPRAATTVA